MYLVQDSHSSWNWIYFIILVVVSRVACQTILVGSDKQTEQFFMFPDWILFPGKSVSSRDYHAIPGNKSPGNRDD